MVAGASDRRPMPEASLNDMRPVTPAPAIASPKPYPQNSFLEAQLFLLGFFSLFRTEGARLRVCTDAALFLVV